MTTSDCVYIQSDPKSRSCLCSLLITVLLVCGIYFIGSTYLAKDYNKILPGWNKFDTRQDAQSDKHKISLRGQMNDTGQDKLFNACKSRCRPYGSETLPEGIVVKTSDFQTRPLWGPVGDNLNQNNLKPSVSLLAIAVGIKQKEIVNKIVKKFLANDFVVMLFHYDGFVDGWSDLGWSSHVIHVSAMNQTKWWFAKRFLHPDIVIKYDYIFLWDEDLGVENFHPGRYISIVKDEGLEISQPALDPANSDVHHQITARTRNSRLHRRFYKLRGSGRCDDNSTAPPCIGWVEMMAPVFSRAAWRCAWYMIQNDLIHAWGLDMQLGYCAQGDRTKKVGVVDAEYIVHLALPTLGVSYGNKLSFEVSGHSSQTNHSAESNALGSSVLNGVDNRIAVRRQSFIEMKIFKNRWKEAVKDDKCWIDPYQLPTNHKNR